MHIYDHQLQEETESSKPGMIRLGKFWYPDWKKNPQTGSMTKLESRMVIDLPLQATSTGSCAESRVRIFQSIRPTASWTLNIDGTSLVEQSDSYNMTQSSLVGGSGSEIVSFSHNLIYFGYRIILTLHWPQII